LLDAGGGFLSYLWNTNEQTQTIWVQDTGFYSVLCTRENMEVVSDTTWAYFFNARIDQPDTIYTCYKYSVKLCIVPDTLELMYQWFSDDPDAEFDNTTQNCVEVIPEKDTSKVYVVMSDSNNIIQCKDSVQIWLYPRMRFDTVGQINIGCPGTCKGQIEVIVGGGLPPYSYRWYTSPYQYDSIAFGLCEQEYKFQVTDEYNCIRDTLLNVEVFDMPTVEIITDPDTSIYIQNPVVTFSFENQSNDSIQIIDWNWNFGDSTYSTEATPSKVFAQVREFEVWLKYTTSDECIDSVMKKVDIKEVKVVIPNIFTPNGDGSNDTFKVKELEYYISNETMVFNRYGKKVFSQNNYQGDWDGDNLKEGVYFYVIKAEGYFGTDTYRGSLTIMR
jgi:gliding motility-associated-like protein